MMPKTAILIYHFCKSIFLEFSLSKTRFRKLLELKLWSRLLKIISIPLPTHSLRPVKFVSSYSTPSIRTSIGNVNIKSTKSRSVS